jgi:hypothetical protein
MFRKILAWMNKRWPEQLVVTKQDYTELRQEVADLNRYAQGIIELNNRLAVVESSVKKLNEANGFVNTSKGSFKLER